MITPTPEIANLAHNLEIHVGLASGCSNVQVVVFIQVHSFSIKIFQFFLGACFAQFEQGLLDLILRIAAWKT